MLGLIGLCFDDRSGLGLVLNNNGDIQLFDYLSLATNEQGLRRVSAGQKLIPLEPWQTLNRAGHNSLKVAAFDNKAEFPNLFSVHADSTFDTEALNKALNAADAQNATALVVQASMAIAVEKLAGLEANIPIVFNNVEFSGADFSELGSNASIVFSSCCFTGDIATFKNSEISKGTIFIGCDFSDLEGLSFRGLKSSCLLLVGQCKGPRGLIWANDMQLTGSVKFEGYFAGSLQINGQQAANSQVGTIGGDIVIGNHADSSPSDQPSCFEGRISIESNVIKGGAIFSHATLHHLRIAGNKIEAQNKLGIEVNACDIHSNLKIEDNQILSGLIKLNNSDIDRALILRRNGLDVSSSLDLHDCTASDALFEPVSQLYGYQRSALSRFVNPRFKLLAREQDPHRNQRSLMEEYMQLRRWLSNNGELVAEDVAFYNQQRLAGDTVGERVIRGIISLFFGWGVRLSHLFASSALVFMGYSGLYTLFGHSNAEALALSGQGFLNMLIGDWQLGSNTGLKSWVIVSEGAVGIILITSLVGAYLRKLLR